MKKKVLLFIHFGNFVSGQVKENTRNSIILNLTITKKGTGEVVIDSAKYTPIYTYKSGASKKQYRVLNIKKAMDSNGSFEYLKREYNKIVATVGNEW